MTRIKFSHHYPKLHKQVTATLLNCRIVSFYHLHADLIEYDTKGNDGFYYKLPQTNLIHLTFLGNKLIPFCTIRRHTVEKYAYYTKNTDKEFKIEIIEK